VPVLIWSIWLLWGCGVTQTEQACREEIEALLVAPATAEYVSVKKMPIGYILTVDAENTMGVPLREDFFVTLRMSKQNCSQRMSGTISYRIILNAE
jgi:hypothetical protein